MELSLALLKVMHPLLPASTALEYTHRAAVGLNRHGHTPGVAIAIFLDEVSNTGSLTWASGLPTDSAQLDFQRVTEDAAEAIVLAMVHVFRGWVIRRRLQRGESADWLLVDPENELVALEISGVDTIDVRQRRLTEKLAQANRCRAAPLRAAGVAELRPPRVRLATN
jgi:hypothetical protein